MRHVLFIDPSSRDCYELQRAQPADATRYIYHSVADFTCSFDISRTYRPLDTEIERILYATHNIPIDGVFAVNDYPSQLIASIIAYEKNLPGPDPHILLPLQDKYYMRGLQHRVVPEAIPAYEILSADNPHLKHVSLPCIVKPIKSAGSMGTMYIRNHEELELVSNLPELYLQPLHDMMSAYCDHHVHEYSLIAENYAPGQQVTVDGYIQHGTTTITGIVDCHVDPYTMRFDRFVYPSGLPQPIQDRMHDIVMTLVTASRLDNTFFNVELRYDHETDHITIIEMNTRMSGQFADMYEHVDGYHPFATATDIACGTPVKTPRGLGNHATSVHFCIHTSADYFVERVPTPDEKQAILDIFPGARLGVRVMPGKRMSACHESVFTYGYMLIRIGGRTEAELEETCEDITSRLPFIFSR